MGELPNEVRLKGNCQQLRQSEQTERVKNYLDCQSATNLVKLQLERHGSLRAEKHHFLMKAPPLGELPNEVRLRG